MPCLKRTIWAFKHFHFFGSDTSPTLKIVSAAAILCTTECGSVSIFAYAVKKTLESYKNSKLLMTYIYYKSFAFLTAFFKFFCYFNDSAFTLTSTYKKEKFRKLKKLLRSGYWIGTKLVQLAQQQRNTQLTADMYFTVAHRMWGNPPPKLSNI